MKKLIINRKSIYNFLIYFCVLIDFGFFYIKGTKPLVSTTIYSILCIVGVLFAIIENNFRIQMNNNSKYTIFFIVVLCICDIATFMRFHFSLKMFLVWGMLRSTLLFSILLYKKIEFDGGIEKFMLICMYFSIIWEILGLLENIAYFSSGIHILTDYLNTDYFIRGGYVRVSLNFMCIIVCVYVFAKILKAKESKLEVIYFVVTIVYQMTIDGTRTKQIALVLMIVAMVFFTPMNIGKKRKLIYCALVISVGIILLQSSILSNFIASFSVNQSNSMSLSTTQRLKEWDFYWEGYKNNWIWGMGDIIEGYGYDFYFNGGNKGFYVEDVGIVGSLARFGIFAGLLYGGLIFLQVKNLILINDKYSVFYSFKIGILIFTLFSMINLSLLDQQSKLYLAVILTVSTYKECEV